MLAWAFFFKADLSISCSESALWLGTTQKTKLLKAFTGIVARREESSIVVIIIRRVKFEVICIF